MIDTNSVIPSNSVGAGKDKAYLCTYDCLISKNG